MLIPFPFISGWGEISLARLDRVLNNMQKQNIQTQINQLESYLSYLRSQTDLTLSNVIIHNIPVWGLCMRGTIRTKEKCPVCQKPFENIDNKLLICKEHFTIPSRYFIDICWNGRQRKIYSDNDGQVLNNYEIANRVLTEIRQQIKKHSFDPADYVKKSYQALRFIDYARKWIHKYKEMYNRGEVSQNTWRQKKNITERHFIPFFKNYDIRDIRNGDIEDFYFNLPTDLEPITKKIIMNILKTLFRYAKRRKDIKEIPDFPETKINEKKIKWIDEETQGRIYEQIPDHYKPIFLFMMRQGVRPGEARALRYEDIDRKARTVTIQRAFSDNDLREKTKTGNIRVLPLDDTIYEMIHKRDAISGFIFVGKRGNPFKQTCYLDRIWTNAVKKAGLEHISLYNGTRHSFASQAVNRGVPLNLIQDFLGHTSQKMTRRYAHIDTQGLELVIKKAKILRTKNARMGKT